MKRLRLFTLGSNEQRALQQRRCHITKRLALAWVSLLFVLVHLIYIRATPRWDLTLAKGTPYTLPHVSQLKLGNKGSKRVIGLVLRGIGLFFINRKTLVLKGPFIFSQ